MKKTIAIVLLLTMLLSLTACGGGQNTTETTQGGSQQGGGDQGGVSTRVDLAEPVVVIDEERFTVKLVATEEHEAFGFSVIAAFENKTTDKSFSFAFEEASVNGVKANPHYILEVAPGTKSEERVTLDVAALKAQGVTEFTSIEITGYVYDTSDYTTLAKASVSVYPYGEDKAVKYVREAQATDNVIIDNDYATVIVTGFDKQGFYGCIVNIFVVNKTDTYIAFDAEDVTVNGVEIDPYYMEHVLPGICAFSTMKWPNSDFEKNSIKEVETIEFKLLVYDRDDNTKEFANETVTLKP